MLSDRQGKGAFSKIAFLNPGQKNPALYLWCFYPTAPFSVLFSTVYPASHDPCLVSLTVYKPFVPPEPTSVPVASPEQASTAEPSFILHTSRVQGQEGTSSSHVPLCQKDSLETMIFPLHTNHCSMNLHCWEGKSRATAFVFPPASSLSSFSSGCQSRLDMACPKSPTFIFPL